ncbi:hypothetical protein OOK29_25940 [Streptomyces phaeochromogenes]|uniref:hypothetical protein n=1 Tax=Streptomyces phaeochromogenes TaxID=1923 RepID=UPI002256129C|nr:hypothetical protein [Streptomyces phaeochromogenes]MCX5601596.1 hypothetical protein [Streptomyces phaeochromogenes]
MTGAQFGSDELGIRNRLRRLIERTDTTRAATPDDYRPRDQSAPSRGPVPHRTPVSKEPASGNRKKPRRKRPTYRTTKPKAPRQSLLDAWDRVPPRVRWLAYHASAAAVGWRIGWVDWSTDTAAWYAAGHWTSPSAIALYALAILTIALYRRSRHWAWPVAWCAAVPVSSVVVGVLLYGNGYHP